MRRVLGVRDAFFVLHHELGVMRLVGVRGAFFVLHHEVREVAVAGRRRSEGALQITFCCGSQCCVFFVLHHGWE